MELLTIITRTLQIFSSFVLLVIVFSFVTIKIKSGRNKKSALNFSNSMKGQDTMSEETSTFIGHNSDVFINHKKIICDSKEPKYIQRKKLKIYAVYNPNSNPNFHLHSKLNWYKNVD